MEQALSDLTVLDLGQVIAMPFCTLLLADMGARVIKVESLDQARERLSLGMKRVRNGVEERVPVYQYRDRNKQAITLNLKTAKGVELFNPTTTFLQTCFVEPRVVGTSKTTCACRLRPQSRDFAHANLVNPLKCRCRVKELVAHGDVVTENFSVGTMERLGLGYNALKTLNPRLVYASITAFGQYGPYAPQRGYDILAQAISGYMSITGFPDNPPTRSGQSISDYYAGMLCAFSIVSALHYRNRTGQGQYIDMPCSIVCSLP
jgi:formyl-CoA transferase